MKNKQKATLKLELTKTTIAVLSNEQLAMITDYLQHIIEMAKEGVYLAEIRDFLLQSGAENADIGEYLEYVIQEQILISEFEPTVTGTNFFCRIIDTLKEIVKKFADKRIASLVNEFEEINKRLCQIDHSFNNSIFLYEQIIAIINQFEIRYDETKLFHTDLFYSSIQKASLDVSLQNELLDIFYVYTKLNIPGTNENINQFIKLYKDRYETQKMPLLQVLDNDIGIGYPGISANEMAPLLENMPVQPNKAPKKITVEWNEIENFLYTKLQEALKHDRYSIEITSDQINNLPDNNHQFAYSLSAIFTITDSDKGGLYVENFGGNSALNLISRFSGLNPALETLAFAISEKEESANPEVTFAEIVHLSEDRIGNVIQHPVFRRYEIPYLAKASVDKNHQIPIADIDIYIENDSVFLYSNKLKKIITPRLTNAHNHAISSLPVYRFLCDLQAKEYQRSFSFHWGALSNIHKFLPRVTYKQHILHPARWSFDKEDLAFLLENKKPGIKQVIEEFKLKWRLPRHFVLIEGDNELLIDTENELLCTAWMQSVKKNKSATIEEFIQPSQAVTDSIGNPFVGQFITALISRKISLKDRQPPSSIDHNCKRRFGIGSEWLYIKIYCSKTSADKILIEAIKPALTELLTKRLLKKWFFIRFNDPHFHLRIRFHLFYPDQLYVVMQTLNSYINAFQQTGNVWKIQIAEYCRELERYGSNTIEIAENIFFQNSTAVIGFLANMKLDERNELRWLWGIYLIDKLLDCFELLLPQKLSLMKELNHSYCSEFKIDKFEREHIDSKYRAYKNEIASVLETNGGFNLPVEAAIRHIQLLKPDALLIINLAKENALQVQLLDLLTSYIHMFLNRLFVSNARKQELVTYNFMYRFYQSKIARGKKCGL